MTGTGHTVVRKIALRELSLMEKTFNKTTTKTETLYAGTTISTL